MSYWTEALVGLHACTEAVEWCRTQPDLATAWARCVRGDWMLWLAGRLSGSPGRTQERLRLAVCARECGREAWPYVEDGDTATAIALYDHILGEWLEARADLEDVRAADAAAAAYDAADAYGAADAYDAASPHHRATLATALVLRTGDAAEAAATAAYAAAYAARKRVLRRCANIVRRHYPDAPGLPVVPRSSPQPEEEMVPW